MNIPFLVLAPGALACVAGLYLLARICHWAFSVACLGYNNISEETEATPIKRAAAVVIGLIASPVALFLALVVLFGAFGLAIEAFNLLADGLKFAGRVSN